MTYRTLTTALLVALGAGTALAQSTDGPSGRQIRGPLCYEERLIREQVAVRPVRCTSWRYTVRALYGNFERGPVIINGSHGE